MRRFVPAPPPPPPSVLYRPMYCAPPTSIKSVLIKEERRTPWGQLIATTESATFYMEDPRAEEEFLRRFSLEHLMTHPSNSDPDPMMTATRSRRQHEQRQHEQRQHEQRQWREREETEEEEEEEEHYFREWEEERGPISLPRRSPSSMNSSLRFGEHWSARPPSPPASHPPPSRQTWLEPMQQMPFERENSERTIVRQGIRMRRTEF